MRRPSAFSVEEACRHPGSHRFLGFAVRFGFAPFPKLGVRVRVWVRFKSRVRGSVRVRFASEPGL